jgi:hypothetical protein
MWNVDGIERKIFFFFGHALFGVGLHHNNQQLSTTSFIHSDDDDLPNKRWTPRSNRIRL